MRTAIAYLRSATTPNPEGLLRQRQTIDAWAEREQIVIVAYHVDEGISGNSAPEKRAGLGAALAGILRDQPLVVANPERVSRSIAQLAGVVASLARRGSELICPSMDLRLTLPLLFQFANTSAVRAER